jgi:hypothetical protein
MKEQQGHLPSNVPTFSAEGWPGASGELLRAEGPVAAAGAFLVRAGFDVDACNVGLEQRYVATDSLAPTIPRSPGRLGAEARIVPSHARQLYMPDDGRALEIIGALRLDSHVVLQRHDKRAVAALHGDGSDADLLYRDEIEFRRRYAGASHGVAGLEAEFPLVVSLVPGDALVVRQDYNPTPLLCLVRTDKGGMHFRLPVYHAQS